MPDAGRQMWRKWSSKRCWAHPTEKIKWARTKQKRWKKELRELENQRKNDEKWETNEKTMKNDLSWNDPWSDHPETQFGPTYPFFRNPEPRPTLRT